MKINLPQRWITHLSKLPESGRGYQRVDVYCADGSTQHDCLVLNCEIIEIAASNQGKIIKDIRLHTGEHPTTP